MVVSSGAQLDNCKSPPNAVLFLDLETLWSSHINNWISVVLTIFGLVCVHEESNHICNTVGQVNQS